MTRTRILLLVTAVVLGVGGIAVYQVIAPLLRDPFVPIYDENCSVCHDENLEGTAIGTPLVGRDLLYGDSVRIS